MKTEHNSEDYNFSKLETFQSIDMEKDWARVSQRIGFEKNQQNSAGGKRKLALTWRVAASIIVILGIGYLSQHFLFSPPTMISIQSGEQLKEVVLPDGSLVSLNQHAELSYPEKFSPNTREVSLKGEAFFEVEGNPNKPFLVSIEKKALVEVLGTSFNIRSEQSGENISVLVVGGSVALSPGQENKSGITLRKGEQATLREGKIHRVEAININMLSWKTGILRFNQSFIAYVVTHLENHYKREIILESNVPNDLKFTSTIENQDLESVLEELALVLGLLISYEDDKVFISKAL